MGVRRFLRAFALALLVSAAAAAQETTFLDDWLSAENPVPVGCISLIHKKTREKIQLVSLNKDADRQVRGYKNKKTGEIIFSAINIGGGETMSLKGPDGKLVTVPTADYDEFPAHEVSDVAGKLKYIIRDDYEDDPEKAGLKDAIVFIPVAGLINSRPAVRHFRDGMTYLAKSRPACVVVIVDTPGGNIGLALELCKAIQMVRGKHIRCVAYVNGENKYAMSAGSVVCLACDRIVMSPRSKMGVAIPINPDMTNLGSDIHDKVVASFAATLRAYADGSSFPGELAAAMADKTLGAVALTVNDVTEVMSVKDAEAAKAKWAASKTPFTERQICPAGQPAAITAEEGLALHAIAGVAETPEELAALVWPKSKRFAIYEPMDRFAQRAKPIMDQMRQFMTRFEAANIRAKAGLTPEICNEAIIALDKILDLQKRNPDFFDPDDSKEPSDLRALIVARLQSLRGR